jgi:hypothetical protein
MSLSFPRRYRQLDAGAAGVIFPGQDGEKTVTCKISSEVLHTGFGAGATGPQLLDAFDQYRARIEALASRKYDLSPGADTVSISLTPADL